MTSGVTRGQALLAGLSILALGIAAYAVFQASGLDGFNPGIASSVLLIAIILVWTGTYVVRVLSGRMTFSEQRRRYREAYDEATSAELERRFDALPPEEQARLLSDLGLSSGQSLGEEPGSVPARDTTTP